MTLLRAGGQDLSGAHRHHPRRRPHLSYREFWRRSLRLAAALAAHGVGKGDTVTVMLSNTPADAGSAFRRADGEAVLHSLNTRLDAAVIAFQLDHAESKVVIVDREFSGVMKDALARAKVKPLVIDFDDPEYGDDAPYPKGARIGRSTTRNSSLRAARISTGRCRMTNGMRSRSTTRPARPAIRRAWSTIIAVRP